MWYFEYKRFGLEVAVFWLKKLFIVNSFKYSPFGTKNSWMSMVFSMHHYLKLPSATIGDEYAMCIQLITGGYWFVIDYEKQNECSKYWSNRVHRIITVPSVIGWSNGFSTFCLSAHLTFRQISTFFGDPTKRGFILKW